MSAYDYLFGHSTLTPVCKIDTDGSMLLGHIIRSYNRDGLESEETVYNVRLSGVSTAELKRCAALSGVPVTK